MFCEFCFSHIPTEYRKVNVRGAYMYFCPAKYGTLSKDCLNEWFKNNSRHPAVQRQMERR